MTELKAGGSVSPWDLWASICQTTFRKSQIEHTGWNALKGHCLQHPLLPAPFLISLTVFAGRSGIGNNFRAFCSLKSNVCRKGQIWMPTPILVRVQLCEVIHSQIICPRKGSGTSQLTLVEGNRATIQPDLLHNARWKLSTLSVSWWIISRENKGSLSERHPKWTWRIQIISWYS